jgi:hypothetical protein
MGIRYVLLLRANSWTSNKVPIVLPVWVEQVVPFFPCYCQILVCLHLVDACDSVEILLTLYISANGTICLLLFVDRVSGTIWHASEYLCS